MDNDDTGRYRRGALQHRSSGLWREAPESLTEVVWIPRGFPFADGGGVPVSMGRRVPGGTPWSADLVQDRHAEVQVRRERNPCRIWNKEPARPFADTAKVLDAVHNNSQ